MCHTHTERAPRPLIRSIAGEERLRLRRAAAQQFEANVMAASVAAVGPVSWNHGADSDGDTTDDEMPCTAMTLWSGGENMNFLRHCEFAPTTAANHACGPACGCRTCAAPVQHDARMCVTRTTSSSLQSIATSPSQSDNSSPSQLVPSKPISTAKNLSMLVELHCAHAHWNFEDVATQYGLTLPNPRPACWACYLAKPRHITPDKVSTRQLQRVFEGVAADAKGPSTRRLRKATNTSS